MTGWVNGVYSKYHCQEPVLAGGTIEKCLKPATLREFRHDNVPLCDEHYDWIKQVESQKEHEG